MAHLLFHQSNNLEQTDTDWKILSNLKNCDNDVNNKTGKWCRTVTNNPHIMQLRIKENMFIDQKSILAPDRIHHQL